jgi:class 3 adenylate cyclase/tetratricopeptide (TPR) repeat protein
MFREPAEPAVTACASCGAVTGEADRFCPACGTPLRTAQPPREARKRVSILFLDIVDSTALGERLDPEPLRQILDRYFAACTATIADHGGVVEKFIGDAVLAVFGAAVAREDDAVRAARAAAGALAALADLNAELTASHDVRLRARCGICSGDVMVVTAPGGDFRVVGDAVNTASRLQNAARPDEILIGGADTAALIRGHVGIEPVAPLRLKGKSQPVPAWRVTDPDPEPDHAPLPPAAPLIGRADELSELRHSFRRVTAGRQVCLVTVLGVPGIGKSRLVQEFLGSLAADEIVVLSGRCSAYGRGVTYKPLADMLGSGPGGWAAIRSVLDADPDPGLLAADSLATIVRQSDAGTAAGIEEIAWAVRYLLDVLGKTRPVIMVWEDLHWAEATLLDLVDEVATWLSDVPVLLLCVARTELLELRPSWGGGKPCATTLEIGPLTPEQSAVLVTELAASGEVSAHEDVAIHRQVAEQCDGNPLFAELMLDVFAQIAPGAGIPPTIHALLGARLDQLPGDERQLLQMAAVIGREFRRDALRAMAEADGTSAATADDLATRLVRRRLLQRADRDTYRFAQSLLRDTSYALTPKVRREGWHMFLARWLAGPRAGTGRAAGADDSLALAYHVEAACLLRRELRPGDPGLPAQAGAAADVLIAEGLKALSRKDLPAAAALLERGRDLLPAADPRHTALALHICDSALGLWDERRSLAALAVAEHARTGDRRNAAACAIQRGIIMLRLGLRPAEQVSADARRIAGDLTGDPGDDLSWCRLHRLQAYLHLAAEHAAAADQCLRLGLARARALGDAYEEEWLLCAVCELAQWTPSHVRDGLDLCVTLSARFAADRALLVPVLVTQAHLAALAGDLDGARRVLATAGAYVGDLHLDLGDAAVMQTSGFVESLAGAHSLAEEYFRRGRDLLRTAGQVPDVPSLEADIARELFEQGRAAAAAAALDQLERDRDDDGTGLSLRARIAVTALRGRLASGRSQHGDAVALARTAGALSDGTDDLCLAADAVFDLAIVLREAGRPKESAAAGQAALDRFETRGAALPAARVRRWLAAAPADPGGRDHVA